MKLAELLMNRADLDKKIRSIKARLTQNAKIQEGENSLEDTTDLLNELVECLVEYERVVKLISNTNYQTKVNKTESLLDFILKKEVLGKKHSALTNLYEAATTKEDRYRQSEIKFISNINGKEVQKMISKCAKEYRETDMKIQETNWKTEVEV